MRLRPAFLLLLLLLPWAAALAASPGAQSALAPALLDEPLPRLGSTARATLRDFLDPASPLVLILWNSDCPDCLENLVEADALGKAEPRLRLLGVLNDPDPWDALDFTAMRGLEVPTLHDPGGHFAAALGTEGSSFSFALVDGEGSVHALVIDKQPDAALAIRDALAALPAAAAAPAPGRAPVAAAYPRVSGSGELRLAALAVGLDGDLDEGPCPGEPALCACSLGGAYGEDLRPLADLLFRLRYELVAQLSPRARAGAFLRLSNEPVALLAQGPEYLSSERGSAFAEYATGTWSARLGWSALHFSPLTLQRWDFADNPPVAGTGGAGGCGACGTTSHALALEALDELGPKLTVEGLRFSAAPRSWLAATAFWARPRRAQAFDADAQPPFAYRQDLVGAQLALRPPLARGRRASLQLHYVAANEDGGSADWPLYVGDPSSFVHHDEVYGALLAAPLLAGLEIEQEATRSTTRIDRRDARGKAVEDWAYRGELRASLPMALRLAAAWLRLGPDYGAEYRALSYQPNTEGWRFAASARREHWGLALFHKRLTRGERPPTGTSLAEARSTGALLSLLPRAGSSLELGGTWIRETLDGSALVGDCHCERDCDKRILALTGRQALSPRTALSLELTRIHGEDGGDGEAEADQARLLFSTAF
jgi:hypothetical protein